MKYMDLNNLMINAERTSCTFFSPDPAEYSTQLELQIKDNSLQVVELSGQPDLQIVVNTFLHTVSSTVFRIRVSLQRLS